MRATSLKLKNFKSVGESPQEIELAPITLLFGPNSAGKSSVLQALIYLREALHHHNLNPDKTVLGGDWLDLGGFKNLIHGRDLERAIEITIGYDLDSISLPIRLTDHERAILDEMDIGQPENYLDQVKRLEVSIQVRWSDALCTPYIACCESHVDGILFSRINCSADRKQIYLDCLDLSHPILKQACSFDEDRELSNLFTDLINPTSTLLISRSLASMMASNRPFKGFTIDDLESLVDNSHADLDLLNKVKDELGYRSSRKAHTLSKLIYELLDKGVDSVFNQPRQFIGVEGQKDALPSIHIGLILDPDSWNSEAEHDDISSGTLRLFCQACIDALAVGPVELLSNWLEDFTYIGPLRDLPARNMTQQLSPDLSRWAKGLGAWEMLYSAPDKLIDEINYWMGDACLKTGYQVIVKKYREVDIDNPVFTVLEKEPDQDTLLLLKEMLGEIPEKSRIYLQDEENELEVMPQDIGVGISQLFPVVVLTVSQQRGLIAIEQPELHIHPAIQVELADLFARYAIKHNKLILLETHSEHLMLRLLRRIRQESGDEVPPGKDGLTKESISVQYVEPSSAGTQFRKLRIDDSGDFLDDWPNGFFEERDEELFF